MIPAIGEGGAGLRKRLCRFGSRKSDGERSFCWAEGGAPISRFGGTTMARSTIIIISAAAAALMATMASGASVKSSPAERAATAALNRKITANNAAEET